MTGVLRVGLVGARFAARLHAENYRPLRGHKVELVAVCARSRVDLPGRARDRA